jgi:Domain of unknown function (DUF4384)/Caspase domain
MHSTEGWKSTVNECPDAAVIGTANQYCYPLKPMKKSKRFHIAKALAACCVALGACGLVHAENHALVMWIGDYGSPGRIDLPGIDKDARNAKAIAQRLGVSPSNMREVSNAALTHQAIESELVRIASSIRSGDNVFIYFSGHGAQMARQGGGCTEGMVPRDFRNLYVDAKLSNALTAISNKAGQVIMLNDSCFSGGAATKSAGQLEPGHIPKYLPEEDADKSRSYTCGEAVNKDTRNIFVSAASRGNNMLYVAASADNEVAAATNNGSLATLAWMACLQDASADTNRSGGIDGEELRACSQEFVRSNRGRQTITLVGNQRLPLAFASGGGGSVSVRQALEDVRASASPGIQVNLAANVQRLKIRQDFLDFAVTTSEPGYLYLLHVGSDGRTYNLLLPNQIDGDNFLQAGTHRFPRQSWRMQAGGPAGMSHVMAVLSKTRRNFGRFMKSEGPIADALVDDALARNIVVTSVGADGGRYGASNILSLQEY